MAGVIENGAMLNISRLHLVECKDDLANIPDGKVLINTINAHSYNVAQKDEAFAEITISFRENEKPFDLVDLTVYSELAQAG